MMKAVKVLLLSVSMVSLLLSVTACPPTFGNCYVFPPNDEWNRPITNDPVDFLSDCTMDRIVSTMVWGPDSNKGFTSPMIRLDAGTDPSDTYGMPYTIVSSQPALVPLNFGLEEDYREESDFYLANGAKTTGDVSTTEQAYLRVPTGAAIEGWGGTPATDPTEGDRHMIVFDTSSCTLTETYTTVRGSGSYAAGGSSIFNASKVLPQRPDRWTSADAAGLPIFPGILKYAEISAGAINHALRFTIPKVQRAYAPPATKGGTTTNNFEAYYGARFRLKASFDATPYSADTKVLITALKTYGLMLADQGSAAFITTENNPGFDNGLLADLNQGTSSNSKRIPFNKANWEMVQAPGSVTYYTSPTSLSCNGKTANTVPVYTPTFNPSCPTLGGSPTTATPKASPTASTPKASPTASTPKASPTASTPKAAPVAGTPRASSPPVVAPPRTSATPLDPSTPVDSELVPTPAGHASALTPSIFLLLAFIALSSLLSSSLPLLL